MTAGPRPPVLIPEERILGRVDELAAAVSRDYAGAQGLLLVGVLRGAFIFLADLARRITVPHAVDFVAVSHYEAGTVATGKIALHSDVRSPLAGRPVLLVEDIVDTGHTLRFLLELFHARGPASLRTCVLVRKPGRLQVEAPIDYLGFDIPDVWAVGYGLDCADRWRTLPYIGIFPGEKSPA
ncbi:MAG TPA: hypoxanthine phosphoribosyltransferase [Candidatus Methanoperedens sp.]|nr:hypoxanthine phosphoribosyltransferase [Candidatus Methanoperedens sp.]